MSPKKAILIISILFLALAAVFAFLYYSKQKLSLNAPADGRNQGVSAVGTGDGASTSPTAVIQEKIQKIIDAAAQDPAKSGADQVREAIVNTINTEIIKQEQAKTPEQKAADLKAAEERQRIIDQINAQINAASKK